MSNRLTERAGPDTNVTVDLQGNDPAGDPQPLQTDWNGNLRTVSADMRSAFAEPMVGQLTPVAHVAFAYGISPSNMSATLKSSGATIGTNGDGATPTSNYGCDLVSSIDNAAGAFAVPHSHRWLHYRAGLGMVCRFTAAFNAPVTNARQYAGLWAPDAEYTVGIDQTSGAWGCFAKVGGQQAVYTLTVTGGATAGGNVTVTLDGTAVLVPVTNVGAPNTTRTAWEIAMGVYSAAGGAGTWGWDAYALGAVVYFVSRRARVNAGAFTFAAGATGATATGPTEIRTGVAEVIQFGSPATPGNFQFFDALDGAGAPTNPSGLTLNKENAVIYFIHAGHLGSRGADYYTIDPRTGLLVWFARFIYMNTSKYSALPNPTMAVAWGLEANGSTTAMTLVGGSGLLGLVGLVDPNEGEKFGVGAGKNAVSGTFVHYMSVRAGPVAGFGGQTVRASRCELIVVALTVTISGGAANTYCDIEIIRNGVYSNLANFAQVRAADLAAWAWQDTTTSTATLTGGSVIATPRVSTGVTATIYIQTVLEAGETIGVNARASAANLVADISAQCEEIQ